jgi:hypothetical protein
MSGRRRVLNEVVILLRIPFPAQGLAVSHIKYKKPEEVQVRVIIRESPQPS